MKSKKKRWIILGIVVVVLLMIGITIWIIRGQNLETASGDKVYVASVADITGVGSEAALTRFNGIVEPQQTWKVEASSDQKVGEIYVKVGDEVKTGDKLFIYNTDEISENLAQAELDLDRIEGEIETTKQQITYYTTEKANASADDQEEYETRILAAQNEQKKSEYDLKTQKVKIEQLKNSLENAEVTSEIDGVVKSINTTTDSSTSYSEESTPFMTILATGDFRIKSTVTQEGMTAVIEGQEVIVYSRIDENQTWKGTMTSVETDNPEKSDSVYVSSDSETSSKFPFYIDLESSEGLSLGQHVYFEMDYGQGDQKEGLWLDSSYVIEEDDKAYVWAANEKDKIEKREITLGEYDEELMKYEILDGLTTDDYIAYPEDSIAEGQTAEKDIEQMEYDNEDALGEDELSDDELIDDEYIEDGLSEDDYSNELDANEYSEDELSEDVDSLDELDIDEYSEDRFSDDEDSIDE